MDLYPRLSTGAATPCDGIIFGDMQCGNHVVFVLFEVPVQVFRDDLWKRRTTSRRLHANSLAAITRSVKVMTQKTYHLSFVTSHVANIFLKSIQPNMDNAISHMNVKRRPVFTPNKN